MSDAHPLEGRVAVVTGVSRRAGIGYAIACRLASLGADVFLHASALPEGTTALKTGARVEFGIVEGRRGAQALSVRVLDPAPSIVAAKRAAQRKPADEMVVIVEDVIKLLDNASEDLRRGHFPDRKKASAMGRALRGLADQLEA